ncbi:cytochrome c oxidase assembly protein COX20, mitochondrial isoform 2-T2 [Chlamydotis macqueenii]
MADEGDSESRKSFKLLGFLDVRSVPCARESVLYGSAGSFVVGLGHFLATRSAKRNRRSLSFPFRGCFLKGKNKKGLASCQGVEAHKYPRAVPRLLPKQ